MAVTDWKYLRDFAFPQVTVSSYIEPNGHVVVVRWSDRLMVSDGIKKVFGHYVDGVFHCELDPNSIICWRKLEEFEK